MLHTKCSWCCLRCPGMNSNMLNICQITATANCRRYWENLNSFIYLIFCLWQFGVLMEMLNLLPDRIRRSPTLRWFHFWSDCFRTNSKVHVSGHVPPWELRLASRARHRSSFFRFFRLFPLLQNRVSLARNAPWDSKLQAGNGETVCNVCKPFLQEIKTWMYDMCRNLQQSQIQQTYHSNISKIQNRFVILFWSGFCIQKCAKVWPSLQSRASSPFMKFMSDHVLQMHTGMLQN